jgi:DNA-binding transcriptional LysR family regulator
MQRENFNDLLAFIAVARERSFTRAAAQLGVSQSALSHTIRALETRLGLRLLTRTTRSVAPTEAGQRLLQTVAPRFEEIEAGVTAVTELRDKPAGTVRITATDYATKTILWPRLSKVLRKYPEIKVEITTDYGLSDIVADHYDIGVRHGDQVAKDMIAVRIAPEMRMAIVGSPAYLESGPLPKTPQDLTTHNCINLRLPTHDSRLLLRMGAEKGNPRSAGTRRGPIGFQRHLPDARRRVSRIWSCLYTGRSGAGARRRGPSQLGA